MTNVENLIDYLTVAWSETVPAAASIRFSQDWWDHDYTTYPQIIIHDFLSPDLEIFKTGGSLVPRTLHHFHVNVGVFVQHGSPGTAEALQAENMRKEVYRRFYDDYSLPTAYGGSLTPLRKVLPRDAGKPLHETGRVPGLIRYELTIIATEDI